jgi:hypothetical protein
MTRLRVREDETFWQSGNVVSKAEEILFWFWAFGLQFAVELTIGW